MRTLDVVIDGCGDADGRHAKPGQITRAAERSVAADGDEALNAEVFTGIGAALHTLRRAELVAARRVKHGAAFDLNTVYTAGVHFRNVAVYQTVITAVDAKAGDILADGRTDNRTNCGVHAGRVAAACEDSYSSDIGHNISLHFIRDSFILSVFIIIAIFKNTKTIEAGQLEFNDTLC